MPLDPSGPTAPCFVQDISSLSPTAYTMKLVLNTADRPDPVGVRWSAYTVCRGREAG